MKRIKVYHVGMGNVWITDKEMSDEFLIGEFDNVPDAEDAVREEFEFDGMLDEDLDSESQYCITPDDDDWELYRIKL